ncbi:hypothetical protein MRX96_014379 [Rhipicephalus microplus]
MSSSFPLGSTLALGRPRAGRRLSGAPPRAPGPLSSRHGDSGLQCGVVSKDCQQPSPGHVVHSHRARSSKHPLGAQAPRFLVQEHRHGQSLQSSQG